jgi:hypothetical protein
MIVVAEKLHAQHTAAADLAKAQRVNVEMWF